MAAFIDEAKNILLINTFVLYASTENVALIADIPDFFSKHWKILPMYRWYVYSMIRNSGVDATSTSLLVLLELACFLSSLCVWSWSSRLLFPTAIGTFSRQLAWEYPISNLETDRQLFPAAISTSFLLSVFPGLTRDPNFCEESFSLLKLHITRLMGLAFAGIVGLSPSESLHSKSSFDLFLTWRSAF